MIINLLINLVVLILGSVFSMLPQVTTLPTIGGYDIDSALVTGVAQLHVFYTSFWPIQDMFLGFVALMAYYGIKMLAKLLLGHRAPH